MQVHFSRFVHKSKTASVTVAIVVHTDNRRNQKYGEYSMKIMNNRKEHMLVNDMCHRAMHTDNRRDQKYREYTMQINNNRKENKRIVRE